MNFLEKNLEDIIFETPNNVLNERGLPISGKKIRQIKIGNYGVADLITYRKDTSIYNGNLYQKLVIQIFELKKNKINYSALGQCTRYKRGIDTYLEFIDKFQDIDIEFSIILIGDEIQTSDDFVYVCDNVEICNLYIYNYKVNGIEFNRMDGYDLKNSGFNG